MCSHQKGAEVTLFITTWQEVKFFKNKLDFCILRNKEMLTKSIPGVNTEFFYIGTRNSVFPYHAEDHDLPSVNYHHAGKPKVW